MKENEEENKNLIENKITEEEKENKLNITKKKENEEKYINLDINNTNTEYNNILDKLLPNNDLDKSFGDIIEDDISRNDTAEFMFKTKKKEDDNEEYKIDEDGNYIITNRTKTKFVIHSKLNKNFLRYSTFTIIIIYTIITIIACFIFHVRREKYPFLFCFKFIERIPEQMQDKDQKDIIYFLTDVNSFYIFHIILLFLFISICYLMIRGTQSEIDYFFKNVSIYFTLTLIFNIPILINGMMTKYFYGSHIQSSIYLGLSLLSFLCMMKIYFVTKSHEYRNISSLVNINFLSSIMSAYQCYCFLFNINYFIMNFYKPQIDKDDEYPGIEITFNSIYFVVGILVVTVYKDIFFCSTMVNMEIGLLYIKRKSNYILATTIVNIAIISLNYASIIIVIFAFNKKVFMLKEKKN